MLPRALGAESCSGLSFAPNPLLRAAGSDTEVQAAAVAVHAWSVLVAFDEFDRQFVG
jgi:hypothetical protein